MRDLGIEELRDSGIGGGKKGERFKEHGARSREHGAKELGI